MKRHVTSRPSLPESPREDKFGISLRVMLKLTRSSYLTGPSEDPSNCDVECVDASVGEPVVAARGGSDLGWRTQDPG